MSSLPGRPPGVERRHVVSVEDHLYHTAALLETLARAAPRLLACTTVCALDDPGTDTTSAVSTWLRQYDGLQVAARVDPHALAPGEATRLVPIAAADLAGLSGFAKLIASLLLPGGVLVQDVHLSTLPFVPPDRWWDSIYVAATVRGILSRHPPGVRFVSNKRGYAATFGRDLMEAGFDPREVMDKAELDQVIVPSIVRDVDARFPLDLIAKGRATPTPVAADEPSRRALEDGLDLVDWDASGRMELGGRLLSGPVAFRSGSNEGQTWRLLIEDALAGGPGVPVLEVGQRLAEPGAERAELSNLAARHIHALRARLADASAIVTVSHAYRLDPGLAVGQVRRRPAGHLT